eukprot:c26165_g2_i1 orf=261-1571(+)
MAALLSYSSSPSLPCISSFAPRWFLGNLYRPPLSCNACYHPFPLAHSRLDCVSLNQSLYISSASCCTVTKATIYTYQCHSLSFDASEEDRNNGMQDRKPGSRFFGASEVHNRKMTTGIGFQILWRNGTDFCKFAYGFRCSYLSSSRAKIMVISGVLQWNKRPNLAGETPRVVVITSGKGGVGKTTMTANFGLCLARLEFKIIAIDADVGLRNLDLLLGLENRVNYTAMEVLNGECRLDQALIRDKRWTNFELLCISKPRYKMPLGFGGKALTWLVDALKKMPTGSPDFILIDCPAGIDAGFITAITPANEAILVTTPDITSLRDADRVTGLLECDGIKDIKMIVNRVRSDMIKGEDMMSVLDVQEMLGLPLLGVIPEDSEVIRSTNRGYPLVLNKPPTLAGLAFEQAAWRLVEQDSMKAVLVEEAPPKKGFLNFLG